MRLDELGRRVRELCLAADPSEALREGYLGVAPPERAAVYRRLVRGVLLDTLENCFPILRGVLPREDWDRLTAEFLERAPPTTPVVRDVPEHFVRFLEQHPQALETRFPYLRELAAYEQAEIAADFAPEAEPAPLPRLPETFEESARLHPVLNPALRLRAYEWPVHRIGPSLSDPDAMEAGPHCLALYREPDTARTRFLELSPESFVLLERLAGAGRSYREAIAATARYFDLEDPAALAAEVRPLLEDFLARGILLGSRW